MYLHPKGCSFHFQHDKKKRCEKERNFFSIDALIALSIILISITVVYPAVKYSFKPTEIQADTINVFSSLKVGEIDKVYLNKFVNTSEITNVNDSILEQIGEFYMIDPTHKKAKNLSLAIFSLLNTSDNIGIWYGTDLIYSKNSSAYENATNVDIERQTISGVNDPAKSGGGGATAYSARAFLISAMSTKYFYFGGYVGDGNIR